MIDSSLFPKGSDDTQVEVINENALVELKISTGFYKRIQALLSRSLENKTQEEIEAMHKEIASKIVKNADVFHYETLLILCKEFEMKAKEQGFVDKMSIKDLKSKIQL